MTEEEEKPDHHKVYGRGFRDGIRAAQRNELRTNMNPSRLKSLEAGLNGFSRNVYDMIPIQEGVNLRQVCQKLADKGKNNSIRIVESCLHDLAERGLCKEHHGMYQRHEVIVLPKTKAPKEVAGDFMAEAMQGPKEIVTSTPFDEIAGIEKELESVSELIATITLKLSGIRNSLAAAAVNIDDHVKNIRKDYAKLEALKQLLKDL